MPGAVFQVEAASWTSVQIWAFFSSLVFGLLIMVASLVAEYRLYRAQASVVVACGFSSGGSQVLELRLNSCGAWA